MNAGNKPNIKEIWAVGSLHPRKSFNAYALQINTTGNPPDANGRNPGNIQQSFHGTNHGAQSINTGFLISKGGTGLDQGWYGNGFYATPSSTTAYKYSLALWREHAEEPRELRKTLRSKGM